jgi:hypothetical protein
LKKGDSLRVLLVGQFCLHITVTPLLIWTSLEQDRRSGFGWDGNRTARFGTIGLIVMLILLGITSEVHKNVLELTSVDGVLHYMLPGAIYTAIVPDVGVGAILIFGVLLWRARAGPEYSLEFSLYSLRKEPFVEVQTMYSWSSRTVQNFLTCQPTCVPRFFCTGWNETYEV